MNNTDPAKTDTKITALFSALDEVFPEMAFTGDELAAYREHLHQQQAGRPEKKGQIQDRLRVIAALQTYYRKDSLRREMEWVNGR